MIEEARLRYPQFQFVCADAQEFDLGNSTFDVIIFSDLLNDLWDVQATLTHMRRYCNEHTRLIFNIQSHLWEYPRRLAEYCTNCYTESSSKLAYAGRRGKPCWAFRIRSHPPLGRDIVSSPDPLFSSPL